MLYKFVRWFLFLLDAETSHNLSLKLLKKFPGIFARTKIYDPVELMGIHFPNRIGLAAGLDKNADYFECLSNLGFGFVEVGTVTPQAQSGNDKPRLFRLKDEQAIINRMGFNNEGLNYLINNIKNSHFAGVLGINIGKNKITPNDAALNDYLTALEAVYPMADYVTVNISSPNTPDLRKLQFGDSFKKLLKKLKDKQLDLAGIHDRYVPLVVKIAPDLDDSELKIIASLLVDFSIDGVIATNTTLSREGVSSSIYASESGGLSGKPLTNMSNHVIQILRKNLPENFPIIGVGGIASAEDAIEKIKAGATIVQIYTGFIFEGPDLIENCARAVKDYAGSLKSKPKSYAQ